MKKIDAKLLIQRLSSFGVPKFTVIRHRSVTMLKFAPNMAIPISPKLKGAHSLTSFI